MRRLSYEYKCRQRNLCNGFGALVGYSADDFRKLCNITRSEAELAVLYAGAVNKAGWLMHDLDDEDADVNTECVFREWSAIEEELLINIIIRANLFIL